MEYDTQVSGGGAAAMAGGNADPSSLATQAASSSPSSAAGGASRGGGGGGGGRQQPQRNEMKVSMSKSCRLRYAAAEIFDDAMGTRPPLYYTRSKCARTKTDNSSERLADKVTLNYAHVTCI